MRTHHLQDRGTWVRSYVGIILWTPFTVWKSNVTRNVSWCATREGSAEKSVRQEDQYILLTPVKQRKYLISCWTCDFAQLQRKEDSLMRVSFYWRLSTRSKWYIKTYIKMIWISLKEISTWSSTTQENQSIHYRYSRSYSCIKHKMSFFHSNLSTIRLPRAKPKERSKDARDITVDLHKVKRPSVRSSWNFLPIPIISNYLKIDEI